MDDKKLNPSPEGDTSWLDELLETSNYGDNILKQMQPLETTASKHDDLDKILQEVMGDNWDLTDAVEPEPPVAAPVEQPAIDDFPLEIEEEIEDTAAYAEEDYEEEDPNTPMRKVRPKRKNGYGLFGLPHLVSTLIWLAIIVTAGISFGRLMWICAADVLAFGREDRSVTITINSQDDINSIADKLFNAGLIEYKELFLFYADLSSAQDKISTGTFELNTLFDYKALVTGMSATSSYRETVKITIPEGYTCAQVFALLEENGVCSAAELMAYEVQSEYWFLEGSKKDAEYPLEGFLYPDTYNFYIGDNAKGVFRRLLARFEDIFTEDLRAHIVTLNDELGTDFDIYDIMIIASMIEKESAGSSENYDISSVIYNRLTHAWEFPYLNIDATIVYAQGGDAEEIDKTLDSPYNTYLYKGLPPTPICNPSLLSIQAALAPAETDYYYYALDYDLGMHYFSKTKAEHEAFVESQKGKQ